MHTRTIPWLSQDVVVCVMLTFVAISGLTDAAYVWLPLKFGEFEVTLNRTW